MKNLLFLKPKWTKIVFPLLLVLFTVGCGDDDDTGGTTPPGPGTDAPIASFQFAVDAENFLTVNFSNFSQNASTFAWDFGDGTGTSTEEDPSYTYAAGGTYTVTLTASEGTESAQRTEMITVTDPNEAGRALFGDVSKTWKLFREGTSMSLGPNADSPTEFWAGLTNDGARPCLYEQEITFHADGTYEFDDMGMFWAEFGVFNNVAGCTTSETPEQCFETAGATLVNACGDDISAWGSGSHTFEYDVPTNRLTLNGMGAWIGIPKLGTSGETIVPVSSVTTQITIEENTGFDVMLVEFIYDGTYWPIRYASYSDASLEPALVTDFVPVEFGEDFPDASPSSLSHSFVSAEGQSLETIESASLINFGAADPAGGAELVGEFLRTEAQFQELQFQTAPEKNDINFENLSTITLDVYFPSSNDYTGTLTRNVIVGIADKSATEQWWTDHQQYVADGTDFPEDEWVTIEFDLSTPTDIANPANGTTPFERFDYDMIFINIGDGNHTTPGTFFVRNFSFQ